MWNFQFFFNKIKPVETLSLDPTTCLYLKIFRSFKGKRPRQPPTAQSYSTFGNAWNNNLMSLHGRLEKYSSRFELAWNSKNDPKKSKERGRRAPRDNVLPDKFQKVAAFLASDWSQKTCVFLPNQRVADLGVVSCVLTCRSSAVRHVHPGCSRTLYTRGEKTQYQNKMQGYLRLPHR